MLKSCVVIPCPAHTPILNTPCICSFCYPLSEQLIDNYLIIFVLDFYTHGQGLHSKVIYKSYGLKDMELNNSSACFDYGNGLFDVINHLHDYHSHKFTKAKNYFCF